MMLREGGEGKDGELWSLYQFQAVAPCTASIRTAMMPMRRTGREILGGIMVGKRKGTEDCATMAWLGRRPYRVEARNEAHPFSVQRRQLLVEYL